MPVPSSENSLRKIQKMAMSELAKRRARKPPAPQCTRDLVLKKLRLLFSDSVIAAEALKSLDRYNMDGRCANDVVHLSILKLSGGRLFELRGLVTTAKNDCEDVVNQAQRPEYHKQSYQTRRHVKAGGDPRFLKKLSSKQATESEQRDWEQWARWLSSEQT